MIPWALEVEYDGTGFMGWQRQKHGLAVQQVMEEAGAKLCNGVIPAAVASGRTDAGVHALGQIVQMELPDFSPHRLREALNYHMKPHPVVVLRAAPAPAGWSARFSAIWRSYRYIISNRPAFPALELNRVWHVRQPLDEAAMHRAAQQLLGHHDFSSFRASACQAKSPLRTLDELSVTREGAHLIIHAKARSFLHHQVRNMVGSLKMVGEGAWPESRVAEVLAAQNRAVAGPTAPAEGLYFVSVGYASDLGLS
ncbi:tRNA pseudouridine(38-40) synthase TruA [Acidocella sp.]|uniref:tRNA pseudouridine(38-40) synthase TruA n=1 Tax=Acidocella sp. TaxID=50710 RepID=UPI002632A69B|nr:tRNA pseudouridine(38-40) synthase TruA [Acidocella sp.]MDD2794399.1 tRNA pseudouridine(38-40) synthase TruA [Acidocella sp.]